MEILVIDLETTGFDPKKDFIVEVGGVIFDLDTGKFEVAMNYVCHEKGITEDILRESWIINNSTLSVKQIKYSLSFDVIAPKLQVLIKDYPVVAYNSDFDFGFLESRGLEIPRRLPDPMLILKDEMKIPHPRYGYKFPSVEEAYQYLFNDRVPEAHRGADDAIMEGFIIYELYKRGLYNIKAQKDVKQDKGFFD